MTTLTIERASFPVTRLSAPIPGVREFQARYEAAVPVWPEDAVQELIDREAPWSEMVELVDSVAPHGFVIYFKSDLHPLMANAGDPADSVVYLMGNHVI